MRSRCAQTWALAAALTALGLAKPAFAIGTTEARGHAQLAIQNVESDMGSVQAAAAKAQHMRTTPEKRIAAGDMLLRTKDYEHAIQLFNQVVELHRQGKASEDSDADARFLLAEAYFESTQYLSARRYYRSILDKATETPYSAYAGRSLSRLVDIALRTNDLDSLDDVFKRVGQLPATDATGSLEYARAKAYFAKHEYEPAKAALASLSPSSEYYPQGQYMLGAILVKQATPVPPAAPAATDKPADAKSKDDKNKKDKAAQGQQKAAASGIGPSPKAIAPPPDKKRYAAAIEQFRKVTRLPPDTAKHRHVIDLAWMAIGRLFYETDNFLDAADAYGHIDRKSPEFNTMLYELAWDYARLGDYQRAQRSLEVLSITAPQNLQMADGTLLRADLMLRQGQFDKSLKLYRSVHNRYDPIRAQVAEFLKVTTDPAVYYDKLVQNRLESQQTGGPLSPVVIDWARKEAENDRAFAIIDDVSRSRELIKKSHRLITKLNAVLGSNTRTKAFPEIKASLEQAVGLLNKVAMARRTLAEGMDDVASSDAGGELGQVRAQRRALMKRMSYLPVTPGDFSRRESSGEKEWNKVSQQLQRLTLEADKLQAIVNGLHRVLKDADQYGVVRDQESRRRFEAEIEANERDLKTYRKRIKEYQEAVDMGRVQIGFGDQRYVEDDQVRAQFRQLFAREVQLVASGQDNSSAQAYARSIQSLLSRADSASTKLESIKASLEREASEKARSLEDQVNSEAANIDKYSQNLDALDQQSRLLVGQVAMRNFGLVRDRLKSIVLRSDVGIVQEAWEVREEQRTRVRDLQRERARENQQLNDELREVLDDAEDEQ